MFIAGDASGDVLGGELITAMRRRISVPAQFWGAGGPAMQAAGLDAVEDFTRNAVFGLDALFRLWEFRRRSHQLLQLARERNPAAIICIDFAGFNRRFAHAIREHVAKDSAGPGPKLIQYVSPQVWASRPGRADKLAQDFDLLLTIFPFEQAWYERRTPNFRVEFVGHPMIDRFADVPRKTEFDSASPLIVLLPGSRPAELRNHLPVIRETLQRIRAEKPGARAIAVLPERLVPLAREIGLPDGIEVRSQLAPALAQADLAIAKSGTITLECAFFGVPTVVLYKTSALTYAIAKRIVQVKWVAMPNLLANEEVFPEYIQAAATPENISRAALELLMDGARRTRVQARLREIAASLGSPGASGRAADAIINLVSSS